MSAQLPPSKQILIFGFLTANGQKISKSLGNGVDPFAFSEKYGAEAVRYYLLTEILPFEDSDFSEERLRQKYNADLANGLGNLVARVSTLLEKNNISTALVANEQEAIKILETKSALADYQFNRTLQYIWQEIASCNEELTSKAPWKLKETSEVAEVLKPLAVRILQIALMLQPFMPVTAEKIINQFTQTQIIKSESLFPRLSAETELQ